METATPVVRDTASARPAWRALARYRRFREHPYTARFLSIMGEVLPKGLYARALLIIITPIVVLEGVIAFAFMERHWQAVTRRLSEATARDIAAVIYGLQRFAENRVTRKRSSSWRATA